MLDPPSEAESLAWNVAHEPTHLNLVPGVTAALILAASQGHQPAFAHIQNLAQGSAASSFNESSTHLCTHAPPEDSCERRKKLLERETKADRTSTLMHEAACKGRLAAMHWLLTICQPNLHNYNRPPMTAPAE